MYFTIRKCMHECWNSEISLLDEPNAFYACFERENTDVPSWGPIDLVGIIISVTEADIRQAELSESIWNSWCNWSLSQNLMNIGGRSII